MRQIMIGALVLFTFCAPYLAQAQEPIIYPNNNQTKEQQEKDEYECYKWAKNESGFDPASQQTAATPPPTQQKKNRTVLRGAARSAAVGAAVGGIVGNSDDAKEGAQIGAAVGGMSAAMRKRDANRQQAAATQNQAAQTAEKNNTFNRAFAACMGGRDYNLQ